MQVLIVKTSSMGDLIHAFPALTDVSKVFPEVQFDWVVEEGFAELPLWHPHVKQVIPIAIRRWRKNLWRAYRNGELPRFFSQLRAKKYDFVIDAQSSIKGAIPTYFARGLRCGLSAKSAREPFVQFAYDKAYDVDRKQHAIWVLRKLFAQVFGYSYIDTPPDYAIDTTRFASVPVALPKDYILFIHGTNWVSKYWPEAYWQALLQKVLAAGYPVVLPWGNSDEEARALRIAGNAPNAHVLPKLKLSEVATVVAQAKAAVCVDTGLSHLSAALGVPAISLYGPTDPTLIGATGFGQAHIRANFPCAPCGKKVCNYTGPSEQQPACFVSISPKVVWDELQKLLK